MDRDTKSRRAHKRRAEEGKRYLVCVAFITLSSNMFWDSRLFVPGEELPMYWIRGYWRTSRDLAASFYLSEDCVMIVEPLQEPE